MLGWGPTFFVVSLVLFLRRLVMRASIGLRIEGRSADESVSRQNGGELGGPVVVVAEVLPVGYLPPPGKGKGKISEIRYPGGFEYLRVVVRYADVVGPNRFEPLFTKIFATRYGPPSGVRIWCPDILTSYVMFDPKMVCFFKAAFENGLRFTLHPFIKSVLQHFNVCPSQLSPNFWGVLVGLLVFLGIRGSGSLVLLCCWISSA